MSEKEVLNDFKENYSKVRKLVDEESKDDPENDPYNSFYKAKDILINMKNSIEALRKNTTDCMIPKMTLDAMWGTILLNIGIINLETEEIASSEKILMEAVCGLAANAAKPEIVLILINIYNNLGILWSNRDEPETAKVFLVKCKEVYENFKCSLQMPISIDQMVSKDEEKPIGDFLLLETAHTLTLYYLAQVYGSMKENLKSAIYCHITLKRQLQYNDYEAIDWALNSATLSQFFAEKNGFYQARHHLAAASVMLDKHGEELQATASEDEAHLADVERLKHRAADVARCWSKYCLLLLSNSKQRLMKDSDTADTSTDMSNLTIEDTENMFGGDLTSLNFPDFDVSKYESQVGCEFLLTYEDARAVFLCCQGWLNKAKEYYTADTLASDYIQLVQDGSQCYAYLAFFEENDERRARMHKRRVDMLEAMLKKVNPLYYMQYCRQLWYELGEVYLDILNIKLDRLNKSNQKPTPQILKKINGLSEKSIEHFENFLNSVKNKDGEFPDKLEQELICPVISALAFIGRNSMKRIAVDKMTQIAHIKRSYASYKSVVDVCGKDPEAAAMMNAEYGLCQSMVNILPLKIKNLESQIQAGA